MLKTIAERPAITAGKVVPDKHGVDVSSRQIERQEEDNERCRLNVSGAEFDFADFSPRPALAVGNDQDLGIAVGCSESR